MELPNYGLPLLECTKCEQRWFPNDVKLMRGQRLKQCPVCARVLLLVFPQDDRPGDLNCDWIGFDPR